MAIAPRTFHHVDFPAERLAAERTATASVCLPARDEAATIGAVVEALVPLVEAGAIDEVVVVDDSSDGTAQIAAAAGATVHAQASLRSELGPVLGKGDAMWRALAVLRGEVVCYLDADTDGLGPHFACGLLGPVLLEPGVAFAKGTYRRPFRLGELTHPEGGGRVTELCARPLLALFFADLAGFGQPLAGEIAARRDLLERVSFTTGYGVDVALLIDAWRAGPEALAQVELDVRQNRHRPLAELAPMAADVAAAIMSRLADEGRLDAEALPSTAPVQRPPFALGSRAGRSEL